MDKIRVAFLDIGTLEWAGGHHYLKNLLYALSLVEKSRIEPIVFVGNKTPDELVAGVSPYATVLRSSLFDRRSAIRIIYRLINMVSGSHFVLNSLLKKHEIEIVSHSNIIGSKLPYRTINWIPDFQFLHLPEMFPEKDISARARLYTQEISTSDVVVVSSRDAYNDLSSFMPGYEEKIRVLNFVSQVESDRSLSLADFKEIREKHAIPDHFFYLPNQFWKHKNHLVVFEALRKLKKEGTEINLVCSGYMNDHRNRTHVDELREFVSVNGLEKNIMFLGLIEYHEVFQLMINSVAVINPSLFEGWSSTVEEAKSIGKKIILSDLPIHREQDPADAVYFPCHDHKQLATILAEQWAARSENSGRLCFEQVEATEKLKRRTIAFGNCYHKIVTDLAGKR